MNGTPKVYKADQSADAFARAPEKLPQRRNASPGIDPALGALDEAQRPHDDVISQLDCGAVADTNQTSGGDPEVGFDGFDRGSQDEAEKEY